MNGTQCMKALCLAGRMIVENGGETYRAEDTVRRMADSLHLRDADVFAVPSGLFLSFTDENDEVFSSVSRMRPTGTHLSRVDRVNQISRDLSCGKLRAEDLLPALEAVSQMRTKRPFWQELLAAFFTGAGFCVVFGGGLIDALIAGLCASLTSVVPLLLPGGSKGQLRMSSDFVSALVCAYIPLMLISLTRQAHADAIIAGAIMPLVPGICMTNAVQDIMRGDMLSGVTHCARAIMIAVMVAGGALVGTYLSGAKALSTGSVSAAYTLPLFWKVLLVAASCFIASASVGFLQYAPRKGMWVGAALGMVSYLVYAILVYLGLSENLSMFLATLVGAMSAQVAVHMMKCIFTVLGTILMFPLVPGLGLYRAMSAIAQGDMSGGASIASHAMMTIFMIALGFACSSTLAEIINHAVVKFKRKG